MKTKSQSYQYNGNTVEVKVDYITFNMNATRRVMNKHQYCSQDIFVFCADIVDNLAFKDQQHNWHSDYTHMSSNAESEYLASPIYVNNSSVINNIF